MRNTGLQSYTYITPIVVVNFAAAVDFVFVAFVVVLAIVAVTAVVVTVVVANIVAATVLNMNCKNCPARAKSIVRKLVVIQPLSEF